MAGPQQFGHYELLDRVNVGGMAEIFRALDRQSGGICAIKRILPEVADDEEFVRMFRDEAKIVGLLEHPNICRVLDLGRVDSTYFLALQYVDGLDLRAIFDRAIKLDVRIHLSFLLHVFMKTCEGLEYAHRMRDPLGHPLKLVHRDVSPQNVLVSFDGEVKLIDFGIAKSAGKLSKTQIGTIKGKYGYMSPEQVKGRELDGRSDLFSLGICLWELLTRKRLFAAGNEMLILERIKEADVPPPRRVEPTIPEAIEQIVMRTLARDANDRYPSAADLYADLQAYAFSEGLVWSTGTVADYMQRTFGVSAAKPSGSTAYGSGSAPIRERPNSLNRSRPPLPRAGRPHESRGFDTQADAVGVQEQLMSDNKGSDLDVFEGLTSKRGGAESGRGKSSAAPPPPPPSRSVPPPPPARPRHQTMMGVGMPLPPMPGPPGAPPTSGPRTSTPPIAPPPGRMNTGAGLPPPPSMRGGNVPPPAPPPPSAQARGAMVDMDWDDEDEKTHVYDNAVVQATMRSSTSNMGAPPPPAPLPLKGTQMGMMAPPLPPPSRASDRAMPPPPPSRGPLSRPPTGGMPMPPAPPPPSSKSRGGMQGGMQGGMTAPLPPPQSAPAQAAPYAAPPPMSAPQSRPADATQVIRQKSGSNAPLILGALVLAAGAGVGAFFWMSSRPGNVLVNVDVKAPKGTKVTIALDGNEKCSGESTCRIEGVPPGAHVVKATAGDVEKKATLNVEPGKDAIANLTLEVASKKTGVKLASSQTGLKVEIDGGSPRALPVEDDTLKPGDHTLKFSGPGARYVAKDMKLTLDEGQIKTIDDVKLALKAVKTKFAFASKGTKAFLDDGSGKKELKDDGQAIELDPAKTYTVTATAPGMEELSKKIEFGDDAEQTVKLELTEKGAKVAVAAPAPPTPGPAPVAPKTATPPAPPTPPVVAGGDGKLFVNTLPASACVVDGSPKGKTPFTISVAPGAHSITCVAKDGDDTLKKSTSAQVAAGETAKVILKLRD